MRAVSLGASVPRRSTLGMRSPLSSSVWSSQSSDAIQTTSELVRAVAGEEEPGADWSEYRFEGVKPSGNCVLHITASNFDEPGCLWLIGRTSLAVVIHGAPGFSVPVKGVATTLSFIVPGETVCLSANVLDPNGSSHCGTVGSLSDPQGRGMVLVNGYDACGGDSGGGWYWIPASVNRHAYGIHSSSDLGCSGSGAGNRSWFTAVPLAKAALAPAFNVELR